MKMHFLLVFVILYVGSLSLNICAQSTKKAETNQARWVRGRVLTSDSLSLIRIKFGKNFKFKGSQKFTLYDRAEAEQFYFVDADNQKRIKRMFIVQFEGFLANNNQTYDYSATKTLSIGGQDYIVNASFTPNVAAIIKKNSETDAAQAASFLESKNFRIGADVLFQRFIRVVDEAKRNEFILIYIEDLSGTGFSAADLSKGGRAENQKDKLFQELQNRALNSFAILK